MSNTCVLSGHQASASQSAYSPGANNPQQEKCLKHFEQEYFLKTSFSKSKWR